MDTSLANPRSGRGRLPVSVLWGVLLGLTYTLVDATLDRSIGPQVSEPPRLIEVFHAVLDLVLPPCIGALLGVGAHHLRLRARLAEQERERAETLLGHLGKIERNQAVWVLSAALLHDIKNPLHSLGLLLDEVLEQRESTSSADQLQLLQRARAQVDKLEAQVRALRALPFGPPPELPLIQLERIVDAVFKSRHGRLEEQRVLVTRDGLECVVRADPNYVRVVLETLLDNSLDAFADGGSEGHIALSITEQEQQLELSFEDNGPGIPAALDPHLFEPLHSTKQRGLGLGLAVARSLCRSMGGDLSRRAGEQGTRFILTLQRGSP